MLPNVRLRAHVACLMVVQVIVVCAVVFLLPSNRFVSVSHNVSHRQVIVMFASFGFSVFVHVGAIFCESRHDFGLDCFVFIAGDACRFHFKCWWPQSLYIGVVGVVVVVSLLLSLSIVHSYLLVTGTLFQVCNAG